MTFTSHTISKVFAAGTETGLTVLKVLEAVRLLGGEADLILVGVRQQADLGHQVSSTTGDPEWRFGKVTKFMGVPVRLLPDLFAEARIFRYGVGEVSIACLDWV